MRIAYVSADRGVPAFGCKGCSSHVQAVLRALVRRGADVELFASDLGGAVPAGLGAVRVHALPAPTGETCEARERAAVAANAALRDTLERHGPFDAVYERYSLWSFAAMEYARVRVTPAILEVNAPLIDEQETHRELANRSLATCVAERAFAAASVLVAVSTEVARYLAGFAAARGRIHVVPNGVDAERFAAPGPGPDAGRPFTVGFLGTLKAWHGLGVLAAAFASVHRDDPSSRLLVVGDGPEREKLATDLAARGLLAATEFTGAVPPGEVPALLAGMDVGVAPYPELEDFYFSPLKILEYMAAGLPVVASRIGQVAELIDDGRTGLLCRPGDSQALAATLVSLRRAPALRARLGRAARATALRNHRWDARVEQILQLAESPPAPAAAPPVAAHAVVGAAAAGSATVGGST